MNPSIKQVADQFALNNWLIGKAANDFKDSDMTIRPEDRANSMHWQLGHVTNSRYNAANVLGLPDRPEWGDIFSRGNPAKPSSELPSVEDIWKAWHDITAKLSKRLEEVTEEELSKEPPWEPPIEEKTVRGAVAFLSLHESYHVGQMAYIRRILGYDQLAG
jgi:uncharacterized damage-inducible protein DinB